MLNLLGVPQCCPPYMIGWEDSLRRLYSNQKDRNELADDLLEYVLEIEGAQDKRRNLKIWLIDELLNRDSDTGFWQIWLINHLRDEFRHERFEGKSRALNLLIEEWREQTWGTPEPSRHDTLYYVLCKRGESHAKRRAALLMQCRRVKGGSWKKIMLARLAMRILESAAPPEESDEGSEELLSSVPPDKWELSWKLQELMLHTRFSDMGHVLHLANDLEAKIEDARPELEKFDHRPDLHLKWWIYQVKQRVASTCMGGKEFEETREMLRKIEEDAQERAPSLADYLREIRGRRQTPKSSPKARSEVLAEFLESWLDFSHNEKVILKIRDKPRSKEFDDLVELKSKMSLKNFSDGVQGFNKEIHRIREHSSINRPKFLKLALSVNSDQQRIRSEKLLGEISHARQAVHLDNSRLACVTLEILHRLLIYRLWWESHNYRGGEPCFELKHAKEIVREIKTDLGKIYPGSRSYKKKLTDSFQPTENMFKKMDQKPTDQVRVNKLLRKRIDSFHEEGHENWNETHGESHILGIPIMPSDESPYVVLNPLRWSVGIRDLSS